MNSKKSGKLRGISLAVGSAAGAVAVARQVSTARKERDRLLLVNAVANAAVVLTGLALAFRTLRKERR
jgi:hypothetical protein